jgi:hypothetical protein
LGEQTFEFTSSIRGYVIFSIRGYVIFSIRGYFFAALFFVVFFAADLLVVARLLAEAPLPRFDDFLLLARLLDFLPLARLLDFFVPAAFLDVDFLVDRFCAFFASPSARRAFASGGVPGIKLVGAVCSATNAA